MADFDLAIIGGGINGTGLARDAAGRGLRVLLVEMNDLGSGTSSASTKLIHGGLRYLEHGAFRLVREALAEGVIRQGASIQWYRKPDGTRGTSQEAFRAYGRTGQPCPVCGTPIERIVVGQRATHYCPTCQRR